MAKRNTQNCSQISKEIPGLNLYFINSIEDWEKVNRIVNTFQAHIKRNKANYPVSQIEKDHYFALDYKKLLKDEQFCTEWSNFKEELLMSTEFTLKCIGLAMYQHITKIQQENQADEQIPRSIPVIRARIFNYEPVVQLREVNVSYFGKFVALRGTVIKAGTVRIICNYMTFYCPACEGTHVIKQNNGVYTPLEKCPTQGCRAKGHFEALYNSSKTKTIDLQTIVIQETDCDMAKIPQTLECELIEDLVKTCLPGDDITISGVIKVRDPNDNKGKNKQNSIFDLYLEGVSVYNNKNESGGYSKSSERITFTAEDYSAIKQIHAQPNLFRYLVHSLCPTIYGHEIVKAGLLLALFRGTKSTVSRAESHVLMIGDPGLGKSQMLKSCANVSPRGVYVCGNISTTSGLTVTMTRESGGEYSLEAGALMLADQGCCCIDEFDKMPNQHACLLEAMEQQSISIAKAGVVCSLPTRPTILVAANPVGGHYNKAKTVAENLKISSPMLSRFDLIFILLDQPNEHLDKFLSKHIMTAHSSKRKKYAPKEFQDEENLNESNMDDSSLRDRLKLNGESIDYLPHKVFRKYIAYAQKYVNPKLCQGAKEVLIEFYVVLRKQFATGDSTPVTARQWHSLIRLTQARAKIELREEATEDDAKDVVEIMKHSLIDVFTNESGMLDRTRSQMGTGMSYKNQVMKLLDILQRKSEVESKSVFTLQEIKEASESAGILKTKFSSALQSLNIQGFLLSKGRNTYQLNSAYL